MRRTPVALSAAVLAAAGLTACGVVEREPNLIAGKRAYVEKCGSCHVLKRAGTTGVVGPDLDAAKPSEAFVVDRVTNGFGAMPAFADQLTPDQIDALIRPATFHERKAHQIHAIARRVVEELGGELPCDDALMQSFAGVGPKCAHLALGIACGEPVISVDIHVHRVVNRWGYVQSATPEQTMLALETKLPERYWVPINSLLVPFGKHICTGIRPKCSTCPVLDMCQQVGVTSHR